MRIRTIKPEFWRSKAISQLSIEDRLLFIGLWSYVDDNGVGLDRLALIAADLFADDLENDAPETFARVSRGLQNLSDRGRIVRYTADGENLVAIIGWEEHQRIDKPSKPRYPLPTSTDTEIATSSRDPRETLAPGTGEQGNRGTEEQRNRTPTSLRSVGGAGGTVAPSAEVALIPDSTTATAAAPTPNRRGTRLPTGWQPARTPANLDAEQGHTPEWLSAQLSQFRDHWAAKAGKDGVKLDWNATWRNWLRRSRDFAPTRPRVRSTSDMTDADWAAMAARLDPERTTT